MHAPFIFLAINLARYSTILPVSSPTGRIHFDGKTKPYCVRNETGIRKQIRYKPNE